MKTAVSLPDQLFDEADEAAKDLGVSRSGLIKMALEDFLKRRREAELTAEIDRNIEKYGDPSDGEEAWLEQGGRLLANLEQEE
jgi:hypothetical protein